MKNIDTKATILLKGTFMFKEKKGLNCLQC